jgi:hypothetical protein
MQRNLSSSKKSDDSHFFGQDEHRNDLQILAKAEQNILSYLAEKKPATAQKSGFVNFLLKINQAQYFLEEAPLLLPDEVEEIAEIFQQIKSKPYLAQQPLIYKKIIFDHHASIVGSLKAFDLLTPRWLSTHMPLQSQLFLKKVMGQIPSTLKFLENPAELSEETAEKICKIWQCATHTVPALEEKRNAMLKTLSSELTIPHPGEEVLRSLSSSSAISSSAAMSSSTTSSSSVESKPASAYNEEKISGNLSGFFNHMSIADEKANTQMSLSPASLQPRQNNGKF